MRPTGFSADTIIALLRKQTVASLHEVMAALYWVVVVGQDSVGSLSPSSSSPESIRLTVPGRTGTHLLNACVASVAGERNKDNCSGNLRVTVRP